MVYSIFLYLECVFLSLYIRRGITLFIFTYSHNTLCTHCLLSSAIHTYVTYKYSLFITTRRDTPKQNTFIYIFKGKKLPRAITLIYTCESGRAYFWGVFFGIPSRVHASTMLPIGVCACVCVVSFLRKHKANFIICLRCKDEMTATCVYVLYI